MVKAPPSEVWGELEVDCLDRRHRLELLEGAGCLLRRRRPPQVLEEDFSSQVCVCVHAVCE